MTSLLKKRTCWIFDLDGTLTLPVHDFGYIRRELAIPDGDDILGHLDTLPPEIAFHRYMLLDDIERELANRATASPGVLELLDYLCQRNTRMGSQCRKYTEVRVLHNIAFIYL
jgi:phosphoglycolate phosphatase-like HAD superfamily hydrolase